MSILGNRNNKSEDIDITNKSRKKRGVFGNYVHYAVMPGIFPRIRALGRHFGHFAYLLALIYQAVRLIQPGHPVLNPANIGTFGFRDVFGAASDNLVLKRENFDQILMHFAVMAGFAMIIIQFLLILSWVGITGANTQAFAQSGAGAGASSVAGCSNSGASGFTAIFSTPCPEKDIAFQMLRNVFGTDLFDVSAVATEGTVGQQTANSFNQLSSQVSPVIEGFQAMLSHFSNAMLVIAILIILYYVFTVVGEAAISGTPFGRRFDGFWAPIRIVFALGMLVPIGSGYNIAQYSTLYIAKAGSGLGTSAWNLFFEKVVDSANSSDMIAGTIRPEGVTGLVNGVIIAEACSEAWRRGNGERVYPYTKNNRIFRSGSTISANEISEGNGQAVVIKWKTDGSAGFGYKKPVCGELTIPMDILNKSVSVDEIGQETDNPAVREQIANMLSRYVTITSMLVNDPDVKRLGRAVENNRKDEDLKDLEEMLSIRDSLIIKYTDLFARENRRAVQAVNSQEIDIITVGPGQRGWAGAGMWHNYLSRLNGEFFDAQMKGMPEFSEPPQRYGHLKQICSRKFEKNQKCNLSGLNKRIELTVEKAVEFLSESGSSSEYAAGAIKNKNKKLVEGFLSWMFGLEALYEARTGQAEGPGLIEGSRDTNSSASMPLATMATAGKQLLNNSLNTFGLATVLTIGGAIGTVAAVLSLNPILFFIASAGKAIAGILFLFAFIGLGIGFLLFYIIPLMPFIYFFFAVANWIAEIFEAIIAMPLFALAHIRIDGGGLPGQAASGGYFLLFGIFIRPVLIVFGMIASILIFTATSIALQSLFDVALNMLSVKNDTSIIAGGSGLNNLFYTIVYAILMYNLATTSFRLIDRIPDSILRWMGSAPPSFSDGHEDPMGNLGQATSAAGSLIGQQAAQSVQQSANQFQQDAVQGLRFGQEDAQQQESMENDVLEEYGHKRSDAKEGDLSAPERITQQVKDQAEGKDERFNKLKGGRQKKVQSEGLATSRTAGTDLIKGGDIGNLGSKQNAQGEIVDNEWGNEQDRALDEAISQGREIRVHNEGALSDDAKKKLEQYKSDGGKVDWNPKGNPKGTVQGAAPPEKE